MPDFSADFWADDVDAGPVSSVAGAAGSVEVSVTRDVVVAALDAAAVR